MARSADSAEPYLDAGPHDRHELLSEYVSVLSAYMTGLVSPVARARACDEALFHLERVYDSCLHEGMEATEAAERAIRSYGDPQQIAFAIFRERQEGLLDLEFTRRWGYERLLAILIFGTGQLATSLYLILRWAAPTRDGYRFSISPGDMRPLFPHSLPLPQSLSELALLYGIPCLWPLLAALVFGWFSPIRPAARILFAMIPLSLYAFVQASFMLPSTAGLANALMTVLVGLPLACIGGPVAAASRRAWCIRIEGDAFMWRIDGKV